MIYNIKFRNNSENRQDLINTIKTTKYMLSFVLKEKHGKRYTFLKLVSTLLNVISMIVYTIMPGLILNALVETEKIESLILYVCVLLLMPVVKKLIDRILEIHLKKLSLTIQAELIRKFDYYTAKMDYETLENPDFLDKCIRVSAVHNNATKFVDATLMLLSTIIGLLAIASIIATLNVWVILMVIIIIYINSIVAKRLNKIRFSNDKKLTKFNRFLNTLIIVLQDSTYGKEIRLFNLKSYFAEMLFGKRTAANRIHIDEHKAYLNAQILYSCTNLIQQSTLYIYLIFKVIADNLSIGNMSIYISAVGQLANSFNSVMENYLSLAKEGMEVGELVEFFSIPQRQYTTGNKKPVFDKDSIIEFKNVSFKYPGSDRYALKNVNISFSGKEKLCIVGANGSGKTTFVKLITRLYFPTEGEILLNGTNINEFDYEQYQQLFSPVFQDYSLFTINLDENIILNESYNQKQLDKVCFETGVSRLVEKLPSGYDTPVFKVFDDEGFQPSGGEGQKIAIARALYHQAPIYLLDEPTAAVDPVAEYEIYNQFHNMIQENAAILITHRLSAVQLADKIAVFDDGNMIEYGTHKQLNEHDGVYADMFKKQAQFYRMDPYE